LSPPRDIKKRGIEFVKIKVNTCFPAMQATPLPSYPTRCTLELINYTTFIMNVNHPLERKWLKIVPVPAAAIPIPAPAMMSNGKCTPSAIRPKLTKIASKAQPTISNIGR